MNLSPINIPTNPIKDMIDDKQLLYKSYKKVGRVNCDVPSPALKPEDFLPFVVWTSDPKRKRPFTLIATIQSLKDRRLFLDSAGTTSFRNPILKFSDHIDEDGGDVKLNLLGTDFTKMELTLFNLLGEDLNCYDRDVFKDMNTAWLYDYMFAKPIPMFGVPESCYRIILLE